MNAIDTYARKYGRDRVNNFAGACLNDNSIDELEEALSRDDADATDISEWGLADGQEWRDAISAALEEMRAKAAPAS